MFNLDKKWLIFILIVSFLILICVLSYNKIVRVSGIIEGARSAGTGQVQKTSFNFAFGLKKSFYNIFNANKIASENEYLNSENMALKNKLTEVEFYAAENADLRKMLDITGKNPARTVAAQVFGRPPSLWFDLIYIDKGASDGVKSGDIAVNTDGLVGKVRAAFKNHSQVELLTSQKFILPGKVLRTGDTGLLYGYNGRECVVKYIDARAKIKAGDVFAASLFGAEKGVIPIGRVKQVIGSEDYMYKELIIEPFIKQSRLKYLRIIKL